ncbi:MAG: hypothetical protein V1775_00360 [Bacteroidota bacterium]
MTTKESNAFRLTKEVICEKNITREALSVINFAYFTANFPEYKRFIHEIWPGAEGDHFIEKFDHISVRLYKGYMPVEGIIEFFFCLSLSNQVKLLEWIEQNYHFSSIHK